MRQETRCDRMRLGASRRGGRMPRLLEDVDEFAIATCDLGDRLLAGCPLGSPGDQRIPEISTADSKADEARRACGDRQPVLHAPVVLAAAENDATDVIAPAGPRRGHHLLAVLAQVETFDLPHVG